MSIAERIKEARKKKKLTQQELGDLLNVTQATVQQYESGKRKPKVETIQRIATALGVDANHLLGWDKVVAERMKSPILTEDLANEFAIPVEVLEAWETGSKPVPIGFIEKYEKAFQILTDEKNNNDDLLNLTDTELMQLTSGLIKIIKDTEKMSEKIQHAMNDFYKSLGRFTPYNALLFIRTLTDSTYSEKVKILEYAEFLKSQRSKGGDHHA